MLLKRFFWVVFLLGCTHLDEKINRLPYYTSKSKVIDQLGSPFKIKRIRGLDHWIYKFKRKGKEYTKTVIFKEGHFLKSGKNTPYPDRFLLLEESENLEEYKEAIDFIKKNQKSH